ncbi:MAG: OsmC family protein [Terriglobales bacterium]
MLGTFAGALDARQIDAKHGRLIAEVRGEIESDGGVLVIRRVHVRFLLKAAEDVRDTVERVHSVYKDKCPVYRSLRPAFEITSAYELVADSAA